MCLEIKGRGPAWKQCISEWAAMEVAFKTTGKMRAWGKEQRTLLSFSQTISSFFLLLSVSTLHISPHSPLWLLSWSFFKLPSNHPFPISWSSWHWLDFVFYYSSSLALSPLLDPLMITVPPGSFLSDLPGNVISFPNLCSFLIFRLVCTYLLGRTFPP